MLMTFSYGEHELVLLMEALLPQGFSALFKVDLSCLTYRSSFVGVGTVVLLTKLSFDSKLSLYNN